MGRRRRHEEHQNHEAWAIPYGDLVTLLLAFFVVMYSISTVNEGKYRAVSDGLAAAFHGPPRTVNPIEPGKRHAGGDANKGGSLPESGSVIGQSSLLVQPLPVAHTDDDKTKEPDPGAKPIMSAMDEVIDKVESSMAKLVQQQQLVISRHSYGVEIAIRTDLLFPSGSASFSSTARAVLEQLADTLKPLSYPMRVEGHTDNRPINTLAFPSNWELSAARAASVVHVFTQRGMNASRLAVIGLGEFRPEGDNNTEQGRNTNRRVVVVILSNGQSAEGATERDQEVMTKLGTYNEGATNGPVKVSTTTDDVHSTAAPSR